MPPAETAAIASCILASVLVIVDWKMAENGGGEDEVVVVMGVAGWSGAVVVAPSLADFIGVRAPI